MLLDHIYKTPLFLVPTEKEQQRTKYEQIKTNEKNNSIAKSSEKPEAARHDTTGYMTNINNTGNH